MSPDDLRTAKPAQTIAGYRRGSVDRLLGEIADSYARVWGERDRAYAEIDKERTVAELLRAEVTELRRQLETARQEPDGLRAENGSLTALARELESQLESAVRSAADSRAAEHRLRRVLAAAEGVTIGTLEAARSEAERTLRTARRRGELLARRYERRIAKQRRELERLEQAQSRIRTELRGFLVHAAGWIEAGGGAADQPFEQIVDLLAGRATSVDGHRAEIGEAGPASPA